VSPKRFHDRHGASRRDDLLLHARRSERHIPQRPTALALHICVGHVRMHRVDDGIGAACIDDGLLVPDEGGNQGAITHAIIDSISRHPRAPLLADCHVSQSFAP
jgi:hypothetical protein